MRPLRARIEQCQWAGLRQGHAPRAARPSGEMTVPRANMATSVAGPGGPPDLAVPEPSAFSPMTGTWRRARMDEIVRSFFF